MTRVHSLATWLMAVWVFTSHCPLPSAISSENEPADLLFVNAKVFGTNSEVSEGIALRGNRIVAVGRSSEIERFMGPSTKRYDAKGASITPGFNDSHVHFFSGSIALGQANLLEATSYEDMEQRIRSFAQAHPNKDWVIGRGWLYGYFPGGLPTREQLDRIIPDRPAVMKCYDGHTLWLNTKALSLAGITRDTPEPSNGRIVKDAQGEPTGVLKEGAIDLANKAIPKPTRGERIAAIKVGIQEAHRLGVTSVQEAGIDEPELEVLEAVRATQDLRLRFYLALEGKPNMTLEQVERLHRLKRKYKELTIGAVKMYADGVIEAHTAAVLEPYANNPIHGIPEYTSDDMNRVVGMLDRNGWQIMIHAIGDAGIRMSIDALEKASLSNPIPLRGRRHRLEHIESISQEDIPRFGKLNIIASMQPYHANPNGNIFNVWAANLGPERASRAWSWKSIRDAGGRLAFGTDWPVVGLDPRPGIHTALTRQTLDGEPPEGFIPSQRLPLREILEAYTSGAAYAEFAEERKGTLAVGMLADLVVWDRDLFASAIDHVKDAKVVKTIFDGQIVYEQ